MCLPYSDRKFLAVAQSTCQLQPISAKILVILKDYIFERELALLVALQGASSWKGSSGGDVHQKSLSFKARRRQLVDNFKEKTFFLQFYSPDFKPCKDFSFKTPKACANGLKPSLQSCLRYFKKKRNGEVLETFKYSHGREIQYL